MAEKKNVRIRLFKDNSRYKGDLFVSVNGVNYKIRRAWRWKCRLRWPRCWNTASSRTSTPPPASLRQRLRPSKIRQRGLAETAEKAASAGPFLEKAKGGFFMTVGEAMERAEELRPGSRVAARTRQRWLCEADGMLREKFFRPSSADGREGVGADIAWDNGLRDDDVLLVPPPLRQPVPALSVRHDGRRAGRERPVRR